MIYAESYLWLRFGFQDGSERVIESLSLIDAVMPDVVESRKAAAAKSQQIKTETNSTNGDENSAAMSTSILLVHLAKIPKSPCTNCPSSVDSPPGHGVDRRNFRSYIDTHVCL